MAVISKIYTRILAALLAWLGFSGTVTGCDGFFFRGGGTEYGTPSATFKAKGVVVSETDNTPIQGIRAVLGEKYLYDLEENFYELNDAVLSNSSGNFNLSARSFPGGQALFVKLTDIDGEANGLFADKMVKADFSNSEFTGGSGNWYRGRAEIDLGTIKMTPDENKSE